MVFYLELLQCSFLTKIKNTYFCGVLMLLLKKPMEQPIVPIYTLREVIDWQNVELINPNIWAFDINASNLHEVDLDYPNKVICFGLLFVQRGEVMIHVDFQELKLKKNDIVNLFPNNILEFKKISKDSKIKIILISIDYFSELNLEFGSQQAFDILSNNYKKQISLKNATALAITSNMNSIQRLNKPENKHIFTMDMLKLHFSLLMYYLANDTDAQLKTNAFKSFRKEDIAIKFVGLVAQLFKQHKDVQYYADVLHVSRTHLTRTIKEVLHKTPKQIIEEKLIVEIKIYLLKKTFSITEIMQELNFEDQAAFSKFFKKHTGVAPNYYRKKG